MTQQHTKVVRDVKAAAHAWVESEGSAIPGFAGAFFAGSTNWMADDALLPASSDVDVKIVLDSLDIPHGPQKHLWNGVVIDVSCGPLSDLRSAEAVLGNYHTAGHFARNGIIADPTGQMRAIQPQVAREYPQRRWVRARAEHAREATRAIADSLVPSAPLHDRIYTWLLTICATPHPVLVADLRNPTIRKSLVAFREVLDAYRHRWLHERTLAVLGSDRMSRMDVETLLAGCIDAFDAAAEVVTTPFFGSSNISALGRPMAIGGIREMIDAGQHREAAYWIGIIHTWCQTALQNDAPAELRDHFDTGYRALLAALGIETADDLEERMEQTRSLLPDVWPVTEEIIAQNRDIVD